ncbi:MAG TPA: ADOP family duplicated permease [Rhodanobacteraceae bacterium]
MNIWLSEIWQSWRASLRKPGFLLLAAGVLALGIGSTVAVFTLIDNVLLKPLPYAQPAQLVNLGRANSYRSITPEEYQHLASLPGISSLGLFGNSLTPINVTGSGKLVQVTALAVDSQLLPTLGVRPLLGRNFNAKEDRPHGPKAVILSYRFWQRRYGGNKRVVGQSIPLEGKPYTIVGVLPSSFHLVGSSDVLLPAALPHDSHSRGYDYMAVARMAPGTHMNTVGAEVDTRLHAMFARIGGKIADYNSRIQFNAVPLRQALPQRSASRPVLTVFMACALFVLLIALVNLVNLMVLRSLARNHDVAVRAALGASPMRLAWPSLAEALLVGVTGALVGLGVAALVLTMLASFVPPDWLQRADLGLGVRGWGMAFGIGLGGALLSAACGVWRSHTRATADELREGGRGGISRSGGRLGKVLVMTQVALATALLCGAGLFLHGLYEAAHTPLGFSSRNVLTFELTPVKATHPDAPSVKQLTVRLLQRLRAQPGVIAATGGTSFPVGDPIVLPVEFSSRPDRESVQYDGISPGFFKTFGIHVRRGRVFTRLDIDGSEPVAVVNQAFADRYFGGDAMGKTVQLALPGTPPLHVVGVVANTRQSGPLQAAPPILYAPLAQAPTMVMAFVRQFRQFRFAVRVHGAPGGYRDMVQSAVHGVAPQQPVANMRTLALIASRTTDPARRNLLLVGVFAVLALLLAAAGMYAVMATAVAAREREFGVRMAVGAAPTRLAWLVLRGGLMQIIVGLVAGVGVAVALVKFMGNVLMSATGNTGEMQPSVVVLVCVLLAIAGLLACLLPALRAARVQPIHALRGE